MSSNLKLRIISGLVLSIIFIISIMIFRPLFLALMLLASALMLMEWFNMTSKSLYYLLTGLVVIPMPVLSILFLSELDNLGWFMLTYATVVAITDTGAMFGGRLLQGPKLSPIISPHKTVSGLVVGAICASLVPVVMKVIPSYDLRYIINDDVATFKLSFYCFLLAFLAQGSDLFISVFKRRFKIKDSGNIIPGHGGVLDRFDSFVLTAPIVLIFVKSNLY